jgi:hypothetical protein
MKRTISNVNRRWKVSKSRCLTFFILFDNHALQRERVPINQGVLTVLS